MPCWRAVPRWPVKPSRAAALGTLLLSLACLPALAQSPGATRYPQRALRLIVPFPPGGSTDILARAVAQSMAESLGQAVVIDNKPGAGGSIGVEAAVHAAPDGYTLVMGHIGTLAVNPAIYSHLPYDPERDLAPIALVALVPNVLVVHPSIEARSVQELVALARRQPGALTYSSGGTGSAAHLAVEYFKLVTRTDIVHVPYKGTGPALVDTVAGQVSLLFGDAPPTLPHIKAGKLRGIAVTTRERITTVPDIPTVHEAGVPGYEVLLWQGMIGPKGVPKVIADKIHDEIARAFQTKEMVDRFVGDGISPSIATRDQFASRIHGETEVWRKVVQQTGIKLE